MAENQIIKPIRNHNPISQTRKIMIKGQPRLGCVQLTVTVEVPDQLFFLVSILTKGLPSDK